MRRTLLALTVVLVGLLIVGFSRQARWELPVGSLAFRIEALMERHVHGYSDGEPSIEEMDRIAARRQVETTCGYVSVWAVHHLREAGYEARVVDVLSRDPANGTDDGHVLIEIIIDGEWVGFDLDQGVWFDGQSVAEWVEADYHPIRPIEGTPNVELLRAWYGRVAQVVVPRD